MFLKIGGYEAFLEALGTVRGRYPFNSMPLPLTLRSHGHSDRPHHAILAYSLNSAATAFARSAETR
jgi:hypothetical protein